MAEHHFSRPVVEPISVVLSRDEFARQYSEFENGTGPFNSLDHSLEMADAKAAELGFSQYVWVFRVAHLFSLLMCMYHDDVKVELQEGIVPFANDISFFFYRIWLSTLCFPFHLG